MTVIQLYSVIHCQFLAPSLAQPQAAESDKPPQASCLMLHFFFSCLLTGCTSFDKTEICSPALETDLDFYIWTLDCGSKTMGEKVSASILFKGYHTGKYMIPKRRNLRFDP